MTPPSSGRASTPSFAGSVQADDELRLARRPPHPFLLSAVLGPILAIPYITSRRQMRPVWKNMKLIEKDIQRLRVDLDTATSSLETTLYLSLRLQLTKKMTTLKIRANNTATNLSASESALKALTLQLNDAKLNVQIYTLRNVGMSLAEVAAFMQEIERNLGLQTSESKQNQDQRGIVERLRSLALRMQMLQLEVPDNGNNQEVC